MHFYLLRIIMHLVVPRCVLLLNITYNSKQSTSSFQGISENNVNCKKETEK
jgi:hypothetical protein